MFSFRSLGSSTSAHRSLTLRVPLLTFQVYRTGQRAQFEIIKRQSGTWGRDWSPERVLLRFNLPRWMWGRVT